MYMYIFANLFCLVLIWFQFLITVGLVRFHSSPVSGHEWSQGCLQAVEETRIDHLLTSQQLLHSVTLLKMVIFMTTSP